MADENAIESWVELVKVLPEMDEEQLRVAINYEVSKYRRKALIKKMHQRYARLNAARIRTALLNGEVLL
jgi:hypothetical protein